MSKDIVVVHRSTFIDNPNNPARVNINTGVVEINDSAFNLLDKKTQEWVLRHEKGHFIYKTMDELKADEYALFTADKNDKNSLFESIESVTKIVPENEERIRYTTYLALQEAAKSGNKKAKKMLGISANAIGDTETTTSKKVTITIIILLLFLTVIYFIYKQSK